MVGEWWAPLILRDVAYGVQRFGELQEDLGISANVLADRLDAMVAADVLETRVYQQRPERHEYRLTEKGAQVIPALLALMQWGDRWAWPDGRGPVRVVHDDCGHEVSVEVRCESCDRALELEELRAKMRRGVVDPPGEHEPGRLSGARLQSSRSGARLEL